jgi:hypothetical protein
VKSREPSPRGSQPEPPIKASYYHLRSDEPFLFHLDVTESNCLVVPVNPHAKVLVITLSGYEWLNLTVEEYIKKNLTPATLDWFSFRPELRTLDLWIASLLLLPHSYMPNPHPSAQQANVVERLFGRGQPLNEPPPGVIHLVVTAEHQGQQREQKNAMLSDMGLRMYRREALSWSVVVRCALTVNVYYPQTTSPLLKAPESHHHLPPPNRVYAKL